jgi:DNA-binding MarR family transcriptional regulator
MSQLPSPSTLETHLGYWMRFVSNHVSGAFRERVEAQGSSVPEWVALRSLYLLGTASLGDLARQMGDDTGAASRLAQKLVKKGLVRRAPSRADRRGVELVLTAAGEALLARLAEEADRNEAVFFDALSARDRAQLRRILMALVETNGLTRKPLE